MIIQPLPLRFVVMGAGWVSLSLGIVGVFLPLLPTTPFVLLAAYCFSKSSARLHHWLIQQPQLGPMIHNWEQHGSISKRAKITATVAMIILFTISLTLLSIGMVYKVLLVGIAAAVLAFIWTRPLPPCDSSVLAQARLAYEMGIGR